MKPERMFTKVSEQRSAARRYVLCKTAQRHGVDQDALLKRAGIEKRAYTLAEALASLGLLGTFGTGVFAGARALRGGADNLDTAKGVRTGAGVGAGIGAATLGLRSALRGHGSVKQRMLNALANGVAGTLVGSAAGAYAGGIAAPRKPGTLDSIKKWLQ